MPIVHVLALYLVTAQVLCNEHGSLEHEIPRRSFLSRRAIDGTRGRKYFDQEDAEGAFDSYGSAGGQYDPYEEKTDLSDIRRNVPGEPGVDYPAYTTLPQTGFTCEGRSRGYYADEDAGCQVFHVCHDVLVSSFLCPIGSTFSQKLLTCDWWTKVDCSTTRKFVEVNRNSYQVDDDEMIRNAYAMISLQSGKDLTRDGLVDPDRSGRVFDFVAVDSSGNDVPNEYEDYNGVQHYSPNYDDYRNRPKTKTSPSYQNTFHSRPPQNHIRGNSRYQDSPIIQIQKFDDPRVKDVSRNAFNQFQPSYAPTVPTVTTTTRRFYSPTVPTTFRPSTVSYNKLDLAFESSDHLYSHSKEERDHVTPPTIIFKTGINEGRSRERLREEDFYDEDEKMAESVERQTYVLSNSTGRKDSSFEEEDIQTRESIGLGRALSGNQKNKLLQTDPAEKSKTVASAWTGAPILANAAGLPESSEESTKLPEKNNLSNATKNANNNDESNEESADFYEPDISGTTTASYESQEIASTQELRTLKDEESTLRPTTTYKPVTTIQERYFDIKNDPDEIMQESSTKRDERSRDKFVESEFSESDVDRKQISSRIDSHPLTLQPSDLRPRQNRFRINIPDSPWSQHASAPDQYPSTTPSYPTIETTNIPHYTTPTLRSKNSTNPEASAISENSTKSENIPFSEHLTPTVPVKPLRFHSTIRIGLHQADSFKGPKEPFASIGSLRYNYDPRTAVPQDGRLAKAEQTIRDRDLALSRDFVVDLPISDIVPPIVDYNDGYDDFLAPNEELSAVDEKSEIVRNSSEVEVLSKYNADLKFTIRGAGSEEDGRREVGRKGTDDETLSTTPRSSAERIEGTERNYGGKVVPLREAIEMFISPETVLDASTTSSPFAGDLASTTPSNVFEDEILPRQSFRNSATPNPVDVLGGINSYDFLRSIGTSYHPDEKYASEDSVTLRPFASRDTVPSIDHSEFSKQSPFEDAADARSRILNPAALGPADFIVGGRGLEKDTFESSVPVSRDSEESTAANPVQFISDANNPSRVHSFHRFNDSDDTSVPNHFNNDHSPKSGFSSSSKPSADLIDNFNREFLGSTTSSILKSSETLRSSAENYPTPRVLSSEPKDPKVALEDSKKSSVTQRSVATGSKNENPYEVESSTPNNLFQSFRPESLKEIEDTIEHSKSPYQVSLTVDKDVDLIPSDDFIARLIAQHEKRNFSNDRIDEFEIIRSVDPGVLSENTGTNATGDNNRKKHEHEEENNNYNRSNIQGRASDQEHSFNSSAINDRGLIDDGKPNNYFDRHSNFEASLDGRANDQFDERSGDNNDNYSGTNYHAQLSDHGRDFNYTVSVTNSTSVKIGNHPQEFSRDSKLNSLSLLQLMAELLKIDRLPRPFALQDPGTIEVRTRSGTSPELIDLRSRFTLHPEIPSTSQRSANKNLESIDLLAGFDLGTRSSTLNLDSAELRTRSKQSLEMFDSKLHQNRHSTFVGANLGSIEIRSRGNSNLNDAPTTTHKPLLISSRPDDLSNKSETHSTESLETSASKNVRPLKKEELLERLAENFGQPIYKINRRPIFDLPNMNRDVDFITALPLEHDSLKLTAFEDDLRSKPLNEDLRLRPPHTNPQDAHIESLKIQNYGHDLNSKNFESSFKVTPSKTIDFDFKHTSPRPSFKFTIPDPDFEVTNFDSQLTSHAFNFKDPQSNSDSKPSHPDIRFQHTSPRPSFKFTTPATDFEVTNFASHVTPSKTIDFNFKGTHSDSDIFDSKLSDTDPDFKHTSPSQSFKFSTPDSDFEVGQFESVEKSSKLRTKLKDPRLEESLKVTPFVSTISPRLTTTSTTTESTKTIVETEFVPSIGFSFDTDEGREEYVEAVLGGLIHGPRNRKNEDSRELEAKNDTRRA